MRIDIPIVDVPQVTTNLWQKFLVVWARWVENGHNFLMDMGMTPGKDIIVFLGMLIVYGLVWRFRSRFVVFFILILLADLIALNHLKRPDLIYPITGFGIVLLFVIERLFQHHS